jgi:hypothetical protein
MGLRGLFGFGRQAPRQTYERSNGALVATDFGGTDVHREISMPVFLSQAWQAANAKARELRWIT